MQKFDRLHVRNFENKILCLLRVSCIYVFDSLCLNKWCKIKISGGMVYCICLANVSVFFTSRFNQTNLKETRNKTFFDCEIYWNLQQYKDCSAHRHTLYWPSKILAMKTFFRQVWGWQFTHKFCKYFKTILLIQRIPTYGSAVIWDYKKIKEERVELVKFYQKLKRGK